MRDLAKKILLKSGLLRVAAGFQHEGAAILMYHSVLEDPMSQTDSLGGIIHSRSVFQGQMELLAREFHPLGLDELAALLRAQGAIPRRSVVVTFDDGYRDNLEIAAPILQQVGVTATFYVTVDCIENGQLPWPSRIRYAIRRTPRTSWTDPSGAVWRLTTESDRDRAFSKACEFCCKQSNGTQEQLVSGIERDLETSFPVGSKNLMLTWDDVRTLRDRGFGVGSHTRSHPNVAQLAIADARAEMVESKARMEKQLNAAVPHFSYPCPALSPHWNEKTVEECGQAGYETAVVTDGGLARKGDNPLCLRRVRPSKTVDGLRWNLEWAFAGRTM